MLRDIYKALLVLSVLFHSTTVALSSLWNDWSNWSDCTLTRSNGTHGEQFRTRTCKSPGSCQDDAKESQKCNLTCSGCIDGGTVNCPVGTIIVNQNQTNHPKKYKINWKIQRPVGEVMEFKIVVKNFNANLTTCKNATDRIELRDLSGYFIGRICSNTSKFFSCSNRVEVTFISSRLESRSSLPKLFLKYTSKLTSGNNERQPYCSPCGGTLTGSSGTIRPRLSPTDRYLPNEDCVWRIKRNLNERVFIILSKLFLYGEDVLTISDGLTNRTIQTYNGKSSPESSINLPLNTNHVVIRFQTSDVLQQIGFVLNYSSTELRSSHVTSYMAIDSTMKIVSISASPSKPDIASTSNIAMSSAALKSTWPPQMSGELCNENLARGRPATQSSDAHDGVAARAVDGNKNTDFHSLSCTHTQSNKIPWWRVDLQSYQMVNKVTLTNRGECCSERLSNLEIRVGDVDRDPQRNGLCARHPGQFGEGETKDLSCEVPMRGRYVYVTLLEKEALTLCEVEVYGIKGGGTALSSNETYIGPCLSQRTSYRASASYQEIRSSFKHWGYHKTTPLTTPLPTASLLSGMVETVSSERMISTPISAVQSASIHATSIPRMLNQSCYAYFWAEWSQWSSCNSTQHGTLNENSEKRLSGLRTRKRGCQDFIANFNSTNCTLVPSSSLGSLDYTEVIYTTGGTASGAPCVFPFKYQGNIYTNCTTVDFWTYWCGTVYDLDSDYEWGYCVENTTPSITECEDTISKTAHWPQACNLSAQCPFDIEEMEEETCLLPTKCKSRFWLDWSQWSSCNSMQRGALIGSRTRTRACQDFIVSLNSTNCTMAPPSSQGYMWHLKEPIWLPGDGAGGNEERLGTVASKEDCYVKCSWRKMNGTLASGVTVDTQTGTKCFCEYGMTGRIKPTTWMSTFLHKEIRNLTSNITECNHTVPIKNITVNSPRSCNFFAQCMGADKEVETETCIYAKKCTHTLWTSWQAWSSCRNNFKQTRKRSCDRIVYATAGTSSCVLYYAPYLNCQAPTSLIFPSHYYFKNATDSPKICNSKCADDPSKTCKALLYSRPNVLCSGDSIESKPCQETKKCNVRVWNSWQPWSSCGSNNKQSRKRSCYRVLFAVQQISNCSLYYSPSGVCPQASIYPFIYHFNRTSYSRKICPSKCAHDSSKSCFAFLNDRSRRCIEAKVQLRPCRSVTKCNVTIWTSWQPWSSCGSDNMQSRARSCDRIVFAVKKNSNCSLTYYPPSFCPHAAIFPSHNFFKNTTDSPKVCDSICADNSNKTCKAFLYSNSSCNLTDKESKTCISVMKCNVSIWSSWQPWSSCGSDEIQSRKRSCDRIVFAVKKDSNCSFTQHPFSICPNAAIYPSDYYFKNSSDSPRICNSKCADNSNKTCKAFLYPNGSCEGADLESKACSLTCNISNCDGGWANWGECSNDCGASTRTRYAYCRDDVACDNVMMETEDCLLKPCAVDGQWTEWSTWSNCSKPCYGGLQKRRRTCTNPPPSEGGLSCAGINEETVGCNFFHCPVSGGYSTWSHWSSCDQPCGGGKISRFRQCNSPTPAFGGRGCDGASTEFGSCNNHPCKPAKFDVFLKFTKETFTKEMLMRNSTAFIEFSRKVKSNLLQLYKGRVENIQDIMINGLSNGSVNCNFTIIFNQSANDELVLLQHAIEDVGIMNTMPVQSMSISSPVVPPGPTSVTATSKTSTIITVKWSRPSAPNSITGFVIFYREFGTDYWQKSSAGYNDTEHELLKLKEFTLYTIRVFPFTRDGMGASSSYVDCFTKEGVPAIAPGRPMCTSISSNQLYVKWNHINTSDWNGVFNGYMIRHREFTFAGKWSSTTNKKTDCFFTIQNLKPFTRYEVGIAGVTGGGVGQFSWMQCVTAEGAPSSPPDNVLANLLSRDGKIEVSWSPLPEAETNGILKGYSVYYTITREGAENVAEIKNSVTTPRYSARVVLDGFKPYTTVKIEVAAYTIAGEGPRSLSVFVETCQCPKNIYVGWYSYEPYIYGDSRRPIGILSDLVIDTISQICKVCDGKTQHNLGDVSIFFNRTKNGKLGKFENEKELKKEMDTNAHMFLPAYGREEIEVYQENFRFILVAYNPGSALLVNKVSSESITKSITKLAFKIWPVILVVLLMGSITGTLLWMADRQINPQEFNTGSYVRGMLSGVWWSFVTMTTVGYGDITPRSFAGKLIGLFWILIGPVLNSLIVGSLTSAITAVITSKSAMLYGMTVAAVYHSYEFNLAIRRNARVSQTVLYHSNSEVLEALKNGVVKGALLDSLSAASMMNSPKLNEMGSEIGKVFKEPHGFGIVLSPEIISLKAEIKAYISLKQNEINERIANVSKALESNDHSNTKENTNTLKKITSYGQTFKTCAIGLSAATVVFAIVCLMFRSIYRRYQRRKVAPIRLSGIAKLQHLEKEICKTADEVFSQIEARFKEISQKHKKEHEKWFAAQKYDFGVLGIPQFGTMDKQKIQRKITLNDIMLSDLKSYPKKYLKKSESEI